MAMSVTRRSTTADLATMPDDGQRYELVRGELLVSPSPGGRHQLLLAALFGELRDHLKSHALANQLLMAPADLTFAVDTVLQPDLFVADTTGLRRTGQWSDVTTLFLVVEILSPSSAHHDRMLKRAIYQAYGVPQYWIVDGEQRLVEVWTPDASVPVIVRDRLVWRHPLLGSDCAIDLRRLFDFG